MAATMSASPALAGAAGIDHRACKQLRAAAKVATRPVRITAPRQAMAVRAAPHEQQQQHQKQCSDVSGRRPLLVALTGIAASSALLAVAGPSAAVSTSRRANRGARIPEEDFTTLESGLKIFDIDAGTGPLAELGDRVAVHYVLQWRGLTFMTSRQGMGVTGGTPYGFDVGSSSLGMVLRGLDEGVQGMRAGGVRQLIIPPELAYGDRGVQEIPPNATLQMNVELLAVKQNAYGTPVKLIEG